jgi:hypothetical protein
VLVAWLRRPDTSLLDPVARARKGDAGLQAHDTNFRIILGTFDIDILWDTKADVACLVNIALLQVEGFGTQETRDQLLCLLAAQGKLDTDRQAWTKTPARNTLLRLRLDWLDSCELLDQLLPFREDILVLTCPDVEGQLLDPGFRASCS